MTHIAFDTLKFANSLKEVGVPGKQAERQAELMAEAMNSQLPTKQDLKDIESNLTQKIKEIEYRLNLKLVVITVLIPTILKILDHFKG